MEIKDTVEYGFVAGGREELVGFRFRLVLFSHQEIKWSVRKKEES